MPNQKIVALRLGFKNEELQVSVAKEENGKHA